MDIRLDILSEKHFKGITNFSFKINGKDANIYGDNGTGKTTQFDAFLWLLFGKDSSDRAQFKIKPQTAQGNDIHMLQTEVELVLLIDGKPLKLKKMQEEKWTKKQGNEIKELTGNTISYWWDEEPVKEGEYKKRIGELIDEIIFRMITDPSYFNTKVPWQNRRKILLQMCGDKTDAEVIASNKKLAKLTKILSGKPIEAYKKILADKLKALEKERADIPPRIDELMLTLPSKSQSISALETKGKVYKTGSAIWKNKEFDHPVNVVGDLGELEGIRYVQIEGSLTGIPFDEIYYETDLGEDFYSIAENNLKTYQSIMTGIEFDMTNAISAAEGYRKRQQELYGLKGKLENVKSRIAKEAFADRNSLVDEKSRLQGEKYQLEANKGDASRQIIVTLKALEGNANKREQLLEEWKELNKTRAELHSSEFVEPDENSFVCPTCGHGLSKHNIIGKLEEMRINFENNTKSTLGSIDRSLENNKAAGLSLKQDTERLQKFIVGYNETIANAEIRLAEITSRISEIDESLQAPTVDPDYSADPEYASLENEIATLQAELDKPVEDITANLLQNKNEVQAKIDACKKILNNKDTAEKNRKRIEELKDDEKRLAGKIAELEGHEYLLDQFVVAKVNLMESNINSHFKYVTFKMFNLQVNGGIDECCDAMVDGVPFSDANHAGKVNAGIDCINALCTYYGVTAPIFIDFRESVSKIIDTDSQVINLIKNEPDKALRVEV